MKKKSTRRPKKNAIQAEAHDPDAEDLAGATDPVTIGAALTRAEAENGTVDANGKLQRLNRYEIADAVGFNRGRYGNIRNGKSEPSLSLTMRLSSALQQSVEELIDPESPGFLEERDGIHWRFAGIPRGSDAKARRAAASKLLAGAGPAEIEQRVRAVLAANGCARSGFCPAELHQMVQGGLELGLVRLEISEDGKEAEDEPLAARLATALTEITPGHRRPVVHVVRNLAHGDFPHDPVAPFMIAEVAHRIVARHLNDHRYVYDIGLAGGMHCWTFVRTCGAESSPFPDDSGDKRLNFLPLTLEPFRDHKLPMADATVAQMVRTAGALLGHNRVNGGTFQSFGYVVDDRIPRTDKDATNMVREKYHDLQIAIFGCGDLVEDGWLRRALGRFNIPDGAKPVTDVCLNLLDENGKPIPLPDRRRFVGVSLDNITRLVNGDGRLALLLTSGPAKGLPITVVARAGCAGTIVCDQAAARAALEHLRF